MTHKLRYNPNNAGQGTYEKKVKIFGNGTKEDFIKFMLEVKDVIRKKPVGTAATKLNLLSSMMLNGKAKIEWNLILDAHGPNRQEADWIACVDELTRRVMGNRATKNFKRCLRYCIHKYKSSLSVSSSSPRNIYPRCQVIPKFWTTTRSSKLFIAHYPGPGRCS